MPALLLEEMPPAGSGPTCDTAGVVLPALPPMVAGIAATEALRFLAGAEVSRGVLTIRAWSGAWRTRRLFEEARPSSLCPRRAPREGIRRSKGRGPPRS